MIHEEICTYEVCKLAKEKGFPQEFDYAHFKSKWNYYNHKGELNGDLGDILKLRIKHKPVPEDMKPIAAPTQSLLQRWLREERGIHIAVFPNMANSFEFDYIVYTKGDMFWNPVYTAHSDFAAYELALEDALKYALKELIRL